MDNSKWIFLALMCVFSGVISQEVDVEDTKQTGCLFAENHYDDGQCFEDPNSCNRCCCRDNGVSCTRMFCPKEPMKDVCEYKGKQYDLNENFLADDQCNTCQCTEGGKVACTLMFCEETKGDNKDVETKRVEDDFACEFRGKRYNTMDNFDAQDGCNVCTCNADGTVACTQRQCTDLEESGPLYEFSPEGAADKNDDQPDVERAVACYYSGTTYMEGESFTAADGCNKCNCGKNGHVACTMMFCVGKNTDGLGVCSYNGKSYDLGETFKSSDNCNTCKCDRSGHVACTEMWCDENSAGGQQEGSYNSDQGTQSSAGHVTWSFTLLVTILAVIV